MSLEINSTVKLVFLLLFPLWSHYVCIIQHPVSEINAGTTGWLRTFSITTKKLDPYQTLCVCVWVSVCSIAGLYNGQWISSDSWHLKKDMDSVLLSLIKTGSSQWGAPQHVDVIMHTPQYVFHLCGRRWWVTLAQSKPKPITITPKSTSFPLQRHVRLSPSLLFTVFLDRVISFAGSLALSPTLSLYSYS